MKLHLVGVLLAASISVVGQVYGGGPANLLDNPDFETGALSPWTIAAGTPVVADGNVVIGANHDGTYGLVLKRDDAIRQNFAAVPVSGIAEISFYADHSTNDNAAIIPTFFYDDGTSFSFLAQGGGSFSWQYFNVTIYADTSKNLNGFSVTGSQLVNTEYLDGFKIRLLIPEPTSCALGLIGACVAIPWRRRT